MTDRYLKCEVHGWRLQELPNKDWACKACYFVVPAEARLRLLERKKYWPGIQVVDEHDGQSKCLVCGGPTSGMSSLYCSQDNPGMYVPKPPPEENRDTTT